MKRREMLRMSLMITGAITLLEALSPQAARTAGIPYLEVKAWLYDAKGTYGRTDDDTLPPFGSDSTGFYWQNNIDASGSPSNPARLNSNNRIWDVYSDGSTLYRLVFQFQADANDLKFSCAAENDGYWFVDNSNGYWDYTDHASLRELLSREKVANEDVGDASGTGNTNLDYRLAQSFTAEDQVLAVQVYGRKTSGASASSILRIETNNGGEPSGTLVSAHAVDTVPASSWSTSNSWVSFAFDSIVPLQNGTTYHIVLKDNLACYGDNIPICTAANDQQRAELCSDGRRGLIVAWDDYRSGHDLYVQRVDSLGNVKWTADGALVCGASNTQVNPCIVSDGYDGAIIAWTDYRGTYPNIYAQRVDPAGNMLWTGDGVQVSSAAEQQYPEIVSDGYHGALIVWRDYRNGATSDIYAQRVDSLGNIAWGSNGQTWWDDGWQYRKKLTFNNSGQSESLVDFPLLVTLSSSNFDYSKAKSDGTDLRFIDDDGTTELKYHIEDWNSSGTSYVWAKVPQIDGSSSTDYIWMYYGNSGASDVQDTTGTYDANFVGVWHLGETTGGSGAIKDATSHNHDGTDYGSPTLGATGKIGNAIDFDGNDDYVAVSSSVDFDIAGGTASAWLYVTDNLTEQYMVTRFQDENDKASLIQIDWAGDGDLLSAIKKDGTWGPTCSYNIPTLDQWYHAVFVFGRSNGAELFVNGVSRSTDTETVGLDHITGGDIAFGTYSVSWPQYFFSGIMDEVRISDTTRSADWIKAQYLSMIDNYITYTGEEDHEGVPVCLATDEQNRPLIISDGHHGAIMTWYDDRAGSSNRDIYAQRVDSLGNCVWTGDPEDTVTYYFNGYDAGQAWSANPGNMVDGDEGTRANTDWTNPNDETQLCNSNTCPGTNLGTIANVQIRAKIDVYTDQGYLYITPVFPGGDGTTRPYQYVYDTWTSWFDVTSDPNAPDPWTWSDVQNIDIKVRGVGPASNDQSCYKIETRVIYASSEKGIPVCTAASGQKDPVPTSDGHHGAIIAWHDYRSGCNIYAQRVDSLGNMDWTADGVVVCDASGDQKHVWVDSDDYNGAVIAWEDWRSGSYADIYAQRIDSLGNRMWTSTGVVLCQAGYDQLNIRVARDGYHGAIVTWDDYRPNNYYDVYAQRVDSLGNTMWTSNGVPVCTQSGDQFEVRILSDDYHGAFISWRDLRSGNRDIYLDRVDSLGNVVWNQGVFHWAYEAADYSGGEMMERASGTDSWTHYSARDLLFKFPAYLLTDYQSGWWSDPKNINHTCAPNISYDITKVDTDKRLECVDAARNWQTHGYDGRSTLYAGTDSTLMWEIYFLVDNDWTDHDTANVHVYVYKAGGGYTTDIAFKLHTTNPKLKWMYPEPDSLPISTGVRSSPVIRGGRVYFTDMGANKKLYSLVASNGNLNWTYTGNSLIYTSPSAVYEDPYWTIYYADDGGWVYAIQDTGSSYQEKWKVQATPGQGIRCSPIIMDSLLYVGSWGDSIHCLRTSDGSQKWATPISDYVNFAAASVFNNVVYLGSYADTLYALNATDGTILRKYGVCGNIAAPTFLTWSSGLVCIGTSASTLPGSDTLYVINSSSFDTYWKFADSGNLTSMSTSCFSFDDQHIYFGSDNDYLYCIDISDSSLVYKYQTGGDVNSSPLLWNGVAYFGSDDRKFYALDDNTQQPVAGWPFISNSYVESSPAISLNDGIVVVGGRDGHVYAFNLE